MSSAGQANEAGSVARSNAATYFAVHMLSTRPVEALENYKAIIHVAFETPDPTDDIVLSFDDGSRAFVSAKRKAKYGEPFIDTVDGWVAQLDKHIGDNDLLVLVCEETVEWVRDLSDALTKIRSGAAASSKRHKTALKRLHDHVPTDKRSEIYQRARIVELPRTATSNDGRTLLVLMMDQLVENHAGSGAVSAISECVHDWAGRALGFDAEKLVGAIAARDIVVHADENGTAAAKAAAYRKAVAAYKDTLAITIGRVDLTLLADDLQPIVVENLLANVRVTNPKDKHGIDRELRMVLRRNRRILMVGPPGSGKTLTMRELAGWCATDPDAPIPVPVHLPGLLPRHPDHIVILEDLVALAAIRGPRSGVQQVEKFLSSAIEKGDAILLLDGLDECLDLAPWMADQIRTLLASVPPTVAAVVATRASAEIPAAGIGLQRVNLDRPGDLDQTIDAVLTQCAKVRVSDSEQRRQWLRIRRNWLSDARENQAGMLQVPQLALLVALIVGSTSELAVPKQRAELLHEAVKESVKRWEHKRFSGTPQGKWASDLTPNMLLDGFVVLGRLMEDRDTLPSRTEALDSLSDMLVDSNGWSLSRAQARELSDQVLAFWDTHVAVFVIDENNRLTSRSRVFTEVATALWTKSCPETDLREWASKAIRYYDSEGVVALALGLNPAMVQLLLELGESMSEATLAVSAAVRSGAVVMAPDQIGSLLQQLGQHAIEVESGIKELPKRLIRDDHPLSQLFASRHNGGPASWPLIEELCSLNLDNAQRIQRDEKLAEITLPTQHKSIAKAWISLADAESDDRPLTPDETEVVAKVLARDLPEKIDPIEIDQVLTFTSDGTPDRGIEEVALRATGFLTQLPEGTSEKIYQISKRVSYMDSEKISSALRNIGVETSQWEDQDPFEGIFESLNKQKLEINILDDISSLGDTNTALDKRNRWSLAELSDLIYSTGYLNASNPDLQAAFKRDDATLRRKWLETLGTAYEIDLDRAAAEAKRVREQDTNGLRFPPDWWVISCRRFERMKPLGLKSLNANHQNILLECMHANSHWISSSVLQILANTQPTWDTVAFFELERSTWSPLRAFKCYFLALLVSPEGVQLAAQAVEATEPARRKALQEALQFRSDLDPTGEFKKLLDRDNDLWVRGKSSTEDSAELHWTCRFCAQQNSPNKNSCKNCRVTSDLNS
ncbi:hypothetical protein KGD82_11245 [Nocardiopsis eucommiae]|uniref:RanBP2-type domain-containing protein n=1 Tax=Nocardiopsis eucommiae TaxID=2831970 RepID=A0A975LCT7_9ACTN|nr:hypothetical protein KGD82_11245 [Nocardiopsis eucommiae]